MGAKIDTLLLDYWSFVSWLLLVVVSGQLGSERHMGGGHLTPNIKSCTFNVNMIQHEPDLMCSVFVVRVKYRALHAQDALWRLGAPPKMKATFECLLF